ncbi:hypothetical protein D4R42_00485 [bacterium]|nr:MAG: hypothetical protein D4R42_00485 [bacterium]
MKVVRLYEGFGKGCPGFNVKIIIYNSEGDEIGKNTYPNVHGPVTSGIFRNLKGSKWVDELEHIVYEKAGSCHWTSKAEIELSDEEWKKFSESKS